MKTSFLILLMFSFSQTLLSQNILTIQAPIADDGKPLQSPAQVKKRCNFVLKGIQNMRFRMQLVFKNSFKLTESRNR